MKKHILMLAALAGLSWFCDTRQVLAQDEAVVEKTSQMRPKTDMTHDAEDSIVRYDIIDTAKDMMSCAAYYDVIDDHHSGAGFVEEVKWLFMTDSTQTEEETLSWIATAGGVYRQYWSDMQEDEAFESAKAIEQQRLECYNLGVARKIFTENPEIEQVE